jgi:hypothetical protein
MRRRLNWLKYAAWSAAVFIAGSVAVAAVRTGSWDPVYTAGWLVPVMIGTAASNRAGHCPPPWGHGRRAGQGHSAG